MSKAFGIYDTIDELSDALREIARLRAENEGLRKSLKGWKDCYEAADANRDELWGRVDKLADENERLRAALEIIAGKRQSPDNLLGNADIARRALGDKAP